MLYSIEEIDSITSTKLVKLVLESDQAWWIPPSLDNGKYVEFLTWNAKQSEPLVLPEGWPTL